MRDGLLEEEAGRARRPARLRERHRPGRPLRRALRGGSESSLHRRYAELLEKRHAGRLERVYPDLVHHFTQGDVPEKAVEYGLKLAQKSLEAFSPEEAARVAKAALDYVEDEEWPGDRGAGGRGAAPPRAGRAGGADTPTRPSRGRSAVKVFERQKRPGARGGCDPLRGGDRLAGPPRGRDAAVGGARDRRGRRRRTATEAALAAAVPRRHRGEPARRVPEGGGLPRGDRAPRAEARRRGGGSCRAAARSSSPWPTRWPPPIRPCCADRSRSRRSWRTSSRRSSRRTRRGTSCRSSAEEWTARGRRTDGRRCASGTTSVSPTARR